MQPDLFPIPVSLSPLAAWKQQHNVKTSETTQNPGVSDFECFDPEDDETRWMAILDNNQIPSNDAYIGFGPTESSACTDLSIKLRLNHWSLPL